MNSFKIEKKYFVVPSTLFYYVYQILFRRIVGIIRKFLVNNKQNDFKKQTKLKTKQLSFVKFLPGSI